MFATYIRVAAIRLLWFITHMRTSTVILFQKCSMSKPNDFPIYIYFCGSGPVAKLERDVRRRRRRLSFLFVGDLSLAFEEEKTYFVIGFTTLPSFSYIVIQQKTLLKLMFFTTALLDTRICKNHFESKT